MRLLFGSVFMSASHRIRCARQARHSQSHFGHTAPSWPKWSLAGGSTVPKACLYDVLWLTLGDHQCRVDAQRDVWIFGLHLRRVVGGAEICPECVLDCHGCTHVRGSCQRLWPSRNALTRAATALVSADTEKRCDAGRARRPDGRCRQRHMPTGCHRGDLAQHRRSSGTDQIEDVRGVHFEPACRG